jgi:hypothetical protein
MADTGQNVGAINVTMGLDSSKFKAALGQAQGLTTSFSGMAKMALGGIAAGFSLGAIVNEMGKAYKAAEEAITIEKQLNATLMATGYAAGLTQDQLINMASAMQDLTGENDEVIKSAENILLTFRNINADIFPETLQLSQDMATTMGQDLNSAILQVGKALNDPIKGMTALSRMGVAFTQQQKDQIKTLVQSGQAHKAQAVILNELKNEFGGAAQASKTYSQQTTNDTDDLREELGRLIGLDNPLTKFWANFVKGLKDTVYEVRVLKSNIADLRLTELQDRLNKITKDQKEMTQWWSGGANYNKERINAIEKERQTILKQIDAVKARDKANAETGKQTQAGLNFNTGTTSKTKKDNPALDAYKSFIDEFKQANNDYEATLKAKKYVEETLGMSAIQVDKAGYDNAITAYKDYYSKIAEINQSEAINKGILLKRNEEKLQEDLKLISLNKTQEALIAQNELIKNYQEQSKSIENATQADGELGGVLGSFQSGYAQKLEILKWYYDERDKITNTANITNEQQLEAWGQLNILKTKKLAEVNKQTVKDERQRIAEIFGNSLDTMLTSYGGFSVSMQQLVLNLGRELLSYELKKAIDHINIAQMEAVAITAIQAAMGFVTGGVSNIASSITGLLGFKKNHSGGYQLPGTKEQLALLKGGERVLSPAETTSYNNGEQGGIGKGSTIVYAPQIKAMDSKDVSRWFNENKNQIINIIAQGAKDNTGNLRTIIQSV